MVGGAVTFDKKGDNINADSAMVQSPRRLRQSGAASKG